MTISIYYHNPFRHLEKKTILEHLPIEVALLVLENLTMRDWLNCSESSYGFWQLSSHDKLWKPVARLLDLQVDCSTDNETPVLHSGYKAAVAVRVEALKTHAMYGNYYLDKMVMNHDELLELEGAEYKAETKKREDSYYYLRQGMRSHRLLRRIGMSNWEILRHYAKVINKQHGINWWDSVAVEYVRERKHSRALKVVDRYISDRWNYVAEDRKKVFDIIISQCLEEGDLNKAIAYLAQALSYQGSENYSLKSINHIPSFAEEKGDFSIGIDMLEKALVSDIELRIVVIVRMIKKQFEQCEPAKAHAILKEFALDLDSLPNEEKLSVDGADLTKDLINIYVKLGYSQKAWELSNRQHVRQNYYPDILRKAFHEQGLSDEAAKAQLAYEKVYENKTAAEKASWVWID